MGKPSHFVKNILITLGSLAFAFGISLLFQYTFEVQEMADSQKKNAGIGLSVCATIIKAHDGSIKAIWGNYAQEGSIKKLQVNMANIRKKLGDKPGEQNYIVNELGVGYRLNE